MARTTKKKEAVKETATVVTRAEKKDATKNLIREILAVNPHKHNELIDAVAKLYVERYGDETDNINDVKGRVGSVLDIMKKESDVMYEGGMYALKARMLMPAPVAEQPAKEAPAPKKRGRKPKAKTEETITPVAVEEKPKRGRKKAEPLPPAPLQPIAPTAPVTPEVAPEPIPEPAEEKSVAIEEKPAPKKRGRKPKAKTEVVEQVKIEDAAPMVEVKEEKLAQTEEVKAEEIKAEEMPAPIIEAAPAEEVKEETKTEEVEALKAEEAKEEPKQLIVKEKAEIAKPVMDMSFLFGNIKPTKAQESEERKEAEKTERKPEVKLEKKDESKTVKNVEIKTEKSAPKKQEQKAEVKPVEKTTEAPVVAPTTRQTQPKGNQDKAPRVQTNVRKLPQGAMVRGGRKSTEKPLTADEKLREAFLKKLRSLGGDYFEYYSVYLLERYSMKNGRRLEGMKISGGDHDGGIDGEIELTDKLGFKETIYIQSKNWNPEKGDEKLWVVGETLLQQFIGACACRQAKDGKQNCRGIFITTSRFTPEAKRILDDLSDKIVGYDGNDLYEAAKECGFGLIQKNGEWSLDERLLSGSKVFFNLY